MPPNIDEIARKYLIENEDREGPYHPGTLINKDSKVTFMVDGKSFFQTLADQLDRLGSSGTGDTSKQGIYIAGWLIDISLIISPGGGTLQSVLEQKARDGVDVRLLVWVNDYVYDSQTNIADLVAFFRGGWGYETIINQNLNTISTLRQGILASNVMINSLDHPLGSSHMKFILICDDDYATAYTGGMDISNSRIDSNLHEDKGWADAGTCFRKLYSWHDVQARIEGKAVEVMYDYYKSLWNELVVREYNPRFILSDGQPIAGRTNDVSQITKPLSVKPIGKHWIQSLRTLPQLDRPWWVERLEQPISFAKQGIYEVQLALFKAIRNAEQYIYVEDQSFWSRDLFKELKARVQGNPELKLIMLIGETDPDDPANRWSKFMLNNILLKDLTPGERDRIVLFKRNDTIVHSKLWLIDDHWALIGSANMTNRSLYTDVEHSVAFVDEEDVLVKLLRVELWGEHFGLPPAPSAERAARLTSIDVALNVWNPNWGIAGSGTMLPAYASSFADIGNIEWDTQPIPSLRPWILMWTPRSEERNVLRLPTDNENIIAVTKTSITDLSLPDSDDLNISGSWIIISSGPNEGEIRKVINHTGSKIEFEELANEQDTTVKYILYQPVLKRINLPLAIPSGEQLESTFESIRDYGEHP